ncbi:HAMP domain-containing sensor histidine kinase [uncultured Hydrogenophaga sp.]|uniref:sensor histidine kinase n=1 Tax=uncultured Hydrogenophaga sp. TaxID=199683 RepID=UPI00258D75F3|nr:HAMP domain-containing sensor histidine kinase [uncultured Hydrogenophaga sp.]
MPRSPMTRWITRLPMTARLSLAVVAVILVTALGTTQIAMQGLLRQVERQIERTGQIYLDGLAAALLPPVMANDGAGIERALDEALRMHQGLVDRHLFLLDGTGQPLARADRAGLHDVPLPDAVTEMPQGDQIDIDDRSYWVWRPLSDDRLSAGGQAGALTVVANLDLTDYVAERQRLWWRVVLFNLGLGVVCAALGVLVMRRLQRPLDLLTRHLQRTGEAGPEPVAEALIPPNDGENARLLRAYNRMAGAAREREALITRMAEQEREAVLGRLSATLAHEVRNPLAGVLTAVDTLRRFGERPETRAEALDFMERGLRVLGGVVDATLATHRPVDGALAFGPQDLEDVRRLLTPQARRAGVALVLDSTLAHTVPLAGGEVRQVLLNLLLNAIQASAAGARVTLRCEARADHLWLEVIDEGAGLPGPLAASLERGEAPAPGAGLGVAVVVRLVQRLRGRVAVRAHSGQGTRIALELPFDDVPADDASTP